MRRTVKRGGIGGTKTDRPRTVVIDSQLTQILRDHRRATRRLAGLVFPSQNGNHLNAANVRNRWHRATVAAAGLDSRKLLHDLRHGYATLLGSSGESILFIRAALD